MADGKYNVTSNGNAVDCEPCALAGTELKNNDKEWQSPSMLQSLTNFLMCFFISQFFHLFL